MSKAAGGAGVSVVRQGGGAGVVVSAIAGSAGVTGVVGGGPAGSSRAGGGAGVFGVAGGGALVAAGGGVPAADPAPPPAPVASFTHVQTASDPSGITFAFTDASTGEISGYQWDFGDGSPVSNNQNPVHRYTTAGNFTVTLTVEGPGGEDSDTASINYLVAAVTSLFSGAPLSGLAPLTVQFTDASTGQIATRLWQFGDGGTSNQVNPVHTYQSSGTWTVALRLAGPAGQDAEVKTGYVTSTSSSNLPVGYETPGTEHNYVIDLSQYAGPNHPVVEGLGTELDDLIAAEGGSLPAGSNVAVCLPAGDHEEFGINYSIGSIANTVSNPGTWGDIHIHLIGPRVGGALDPGSVAYDSRGYYVGTGTCNITPSSRSGQSWDLIRINPTSDWPSRLSFWSMSMRSRGRMIVGHGSKDDPTAGGLQAGVHSPAGSQLWFHEIDFREPDGHTSDYPSQDTLGANSGWNKWAVHCFWTAPNFKDCIFDLPFTDEHCCYAHHQQAEDSGMDNVLVVRVGSQIWQETCRDFLTLGTDAYALDLCWNGGGGLPPNGSQQYEGDYMGAATTTINRVRIENGGGFGSRSSSFFHFYSSGRTVVFTNNEIAQWLPASNGVNPNGAFVDLKSPRMLLVSANTYWSEKDDCTPDTNPGTPSAVPGSVYERAFRRFGDFMFDSVTVTGNTLIMGAGIGGGSGKNAINIESVRDTCVIEDNHVVADNNNGGLGSGSIYFCREGKTGTNGTAYRFHQASMDIGDMTFRNNNSTGQGSTYDRALLAFPTAPVATLNNNTGVGSGVTGATPQGGPETNTVQLGTTLDEWVNDTTNFVEYPFGE